MAELVGDLPQKQVRNPEYEKARELARANPGAWVSLETNTGAGGAYRLFRDQGFECRRFNRVFHIRWQPR